MDIKTLAGLGRVKDIIMILIKYGFDDLVNRLEVPGIGFVKKVHKADHEMSTFQRIRCALEDLGPTFVKFGQIMSLRPDLLPSGLIDELSKLQDEVASIEFPRIKEAIEKDTGQPLNDIFSIFDPEPLAAASVSQVHRGVLKVDGRIVSVKVQRPDIKTKIRRDLDILASIAEHAHERIHDLKAYDLPNLIHVIRRTLLRELDFKREARNMKIAASYNSEGSEIFIPEVYEEFCTDHLLVMEFVHGTKLKDLKTATLIDPESLAKQGLKTAMKQILDDGFFHADPHPGNILINSEERICLMDWGMTGRLSERDRYELIDLIKSIVARDAEAVVHALLHLGNPKEKINRRGLEREIMDVLDTHFTVPIKDMNIGRLLMAITELLRTYRLRLPADLVIMIKALITAEGSARLIYPDLDVISEARDYISSLSMKRFKPEALWRSIRFTISQFLSLNREIPERMVQVLNKAESGDLTLGFRHQNLGGLRHTLDNITNRLTFGIIIAAMIIGSSMIITTGIGPLLFGFPAIGVIGYLISGLLGLWLIFNIIKGRKY